MMKKLFLCLVVASVSLFAYAQNVTVNTSHKTISIEQLISEIERQTNYSFIYDSNEVDVHKEVALPQASGNVKQLLAAAFGKNSGYSFKITNSSIAIVPAVVAAAAPQRSIKGKVVDTSSEPLTGATLLVKGTSKGFTADIEGNFEIEGVKFPVTVVVSYIGFQDEEVELKGTESSPLTITLRPDSQFIDDVVVVGYASMKKRDLVGAVDAVGSDVISNRANSNLTRSLQGEVAGLNITFSDSKPSHGGSYNVRGTGSIGAGGSALVLIDGVEGSINSVNPQDVASVSVLKDASSTAVYGARGAFGVILVTTKNAHHGRPVVNYSSSVSVNSRTVVPDNITDSNEWLDWWIACYNGYYNGSKALLNHIDSKAPYSQQIYDEIIRRKSDSTLAKVEESNAVSGFGYAYYDNTDWMNEFYRKAHLSTEHNISVSGGSEYADYYVSGRFYGSDGVFKVGNEDFKKYALRAKGSLMIRPWMKLTNNASISIDKNYIPMGTTNNSVQRYMQHCVQPMAPLKNPDGTWTPAAGISGYAAFVEGNNYKTDNYTYVRDKIDLTIDILKDVLKFQADYSYNYTQREAIRIYNPIQYSKSPGKIESTSSDGGQKSQVNYDTRYQATNEYLTWTPRLGANHSFTGLLGYNMEWSTYKTLTTSRLSFVKQGKPSFSLMDGEATISEGGNQWAYMGAFFRANYSYKGRYLAEVSGRYDGSSKFPTNSRWGFFPSGSIGWRISDEPWMKWSRSVLDNLKFRASAGSMGNGNVSPYKYTSEMTVSKASDIVIDGSLPSYTGIASLVPMSLTWEKSTTYDAGFDLDMFRNRLSASFDYYVRMTSDMYTTGVTLPGVYGASAPKGNNAELRTNGWEFTLSWRDEFKLGGKPFSYSIKGTVWDSMSTITKYAGNDANSFGSIQTIIDNMGQPQYYVGMKIGEMWGYTVEGLFKDWEDIDSHAKQTFKQASDKVTRPGQVKFKDLDYSTVIDYGKLTLEDHGDLSIIGNTTPRYRFGINLAANWNNIGVSVFLQGVGKRDWYPGYDAGYFWGKYGRPFFYFIPTIHALSNPTVAQMSDDGSECYNYDTAYWPRPTTYQTNSDTDANTVLSIPNTRYKQNAAYLRVKNVQIDYSFNKRFCDKLQISGLKVFLSGENLFCFTPLHKWAPNLDPEGIDGGDTDYGSSSLNGNSYPTLKSVTFGANLTF